MMRIVGWKPDISIFSGFPGDYEATFGLELFWIIAYVELYLMLFPSECFPTETTEFKLKNIFENLKLKVLFVWVATLDKKTNNIKKSTIAKKCFNSFQKEL